MTMTQQRIDQESKAWRSRVTGLLEKIANAIIEKPRRSTDEATGTWIVRAVEVVTASTVYRGPDIAIPKGYTTAVKQRRHAGAPIGYVAASRGDVGGNLSRAELRDGESIEIQVTNMKEIYFTADTNNTFFEIISEL